MAHGRNVGDNREGTAMAMEMRAARADEFDEFGLIGA